MTLFFFFIATPNSVTVESEYGNGCVHIDG